MLCLPHLCISVSLPVVLLTNYFEFLFSFLMNVMMQIAVSLVCVYYVYVIPDKLACCCLSAVVLN